MNEWKEAVHSASRGDREAIAALMERYLPGLRAFVRLKMGPALRARESASDLVQSACREVLTHLGRYRHRGESNFRRWLFTTAMRKVRDRADYHRARKRDIGRELPDPDSLAKVYADVMTPSAHLDQKERVARFEAAFDSLSEDHREVILLSRIVGLSHREIGEAMHRSETAARMLLYRALAELASRLDRE